MFIWNEIAKNNEINNKKASHGTQMDTVISMDNRCVDTFYVHCERREWHRHRPNMPTDAA